MATGYDHDYYTWTQEQAAYIRAGQFNRLDIEHLAEEIADMGKSEIREFASRLAIIIGHILKLAIQTERTSSNERSWRTTIKTQRASLQRLIARNPGLKNSAIQADVLADAWGDGRLLAIKETGLDPDRFPEEPQYTVQQLLEET